MSSASKINHKSTQWKNLSVLLFNIISVLTTLCCWTPSSPNCILIILTFSYRLIISIRAIYRIRVFNKYRTRNRKGFFCSCCFFIINNHRSLYINLIKLMFTISSGNPITRNQIKRLICLRDIVIQLNGLSYRQGIIHPVIVEVKCECGIVKDNRIILSFDKGIYQIEITLISFTEE